MPFGACRQLRNASPPFATPSPKTEQDIEGSVRYTGEGLVATLDQKPVSRREGLAVRPNRAQRLDDRHQVVQGFEWIAARSRRHASHAVIGGKWLSVIGRYSQSLDADNDFVLQPPSVQVTRGSLRSPGDLCLC